MISLLLHSFSTSPQKCNHFPRIHFNAHLDCLAWYSTLLTSWRAKRLTLSGNGVMVTQLSSKLLICNLLNSFSGYCDCFFKVTDCSNRVSQPQRLVGHQASLVGHRPTPRLANDVYWCKFRCFPVLRDRVYMTNVFSGIPLIWGVKVLHWIDIPNLNCVRICKKMFPACIWFNKFDNS